LYVKPQYCDRYIVFVLVIPVVGYSKSFWYLFVINFLTKMSAKELKAIADVGIICRFGPSATSLGPVYDQNSVMEFGFEMVCDQVRAISTLSR